MKNKTKSSKIILTIVAVIVSLGGAYFIFGQIEYSYACSHYVSAHISVEYDKPYNSQSSDGESIALSDGVSVRTEYGYFTTKYYLNGSDKPFYKINQKLKSDVRFLYDDGNIYIINSRRKTDAPTIKGNIKAHKYDEVIKYKCTDGTTEKVFGTNENEFVLFCNFSKNVVYDSDKNHVEVKNSSDNKIIKEYDLGGVVTQNTSTEICFTLIDGCLFVKQDDSLVYVIEI